MFCVCGDALSLYVFILCEALTSVLITHSQGMFISPPIADFLYSSDHRLTGYVLYFAPSADSSYSSDLTLTGLGLYCHKALTYHILVISH